HLIERIHHLAALAMVRHILEMIEKCDCFEKRPTVWCHVVHSHPPLNESKGSTSIRRFSDSSRTSSPDCPVLFGGPAFENARFDCDPVVGQMRGQALYIVL